MHTYHCTITCEVDGLDRDDAVAAFTEWLTDQRNIEEGTIVTTDDDPANPDTIWHNLTLAAKRSWVQAMQPQPDGDAWYCDECGALLDEAARSNLGPEHAESCSLWAPQYPDLSDEPPISADDLDRIVVEYVRIVNANTTGDWNAKQDVIDAIRHDGAQPTPIGTAAGTRYDIASEMAETAAHMGIVAPDVDGEPDAHDAYMDQLHDMLPEVDLRLRGTTREDA